MHKTVYMKKTLILTLLFLVFSVSAAAEISSDLQNELDQLGPQDRVEVLVQTGPSMTDQHVQAMNQQGEVKNRYDLFNGVHLELPVPAVEAISNLDFVESVEPNYEVEVTLSESTEQVEANHIWNNYNTTGEEVETAVLDTGVQAEHSQLNVVEEVDFTGEGTDDLNGHGTHVAGIIGSQDETNRGVAYNSDLFDVKVLNEDGQGSGSDLLEGMEWTVENNIDIAVMSLGAEVEECDGEDFLSQAVDDMVEEGVYVTVAAGNEGPEEETITIPGCSREATTVGAVDKNDELADYSSRGPTSNGKTKPDVVAPGTSIESTWNDNGFNTISGTSMATPHVAGQAALLLEEDPNLTPTELKQTITETSTDLGFDSNEQGDGRINVSQSFYAVSDQERNETEEEQEEGTEEEQEETETGPPEQDQPQTPEAEARAEGRMRFGPESRFYGLRIAADRASVSLGLRTNEQVMERRAQEARTMMERGNQEASERALGEMRRTAGDRENATQQAQETLERVMQDAPEEAQEGLRNALQNVEQQRGQRGQQQQEERPEQGQQEQRPEDSVPEEPPQEQPEQAPEESGSPEEGEQREPPTPDETQSDEELKDQPETPRQEETETHGGQQETPEDQEQSEQETQQEESNETSNETDTETPQQDEETGSDQQGNNVGQFFRDRLSLN